MKLFRFRLRFSVRGLMIAVLICGGLFGWKAHRVSIQRRAVAEIERAGGEVAYDYEVSAEGGIIAHAAPRTPRWLRRTFGDEFFQEVVFVSLEENNPSETEPDERTLAAIATLDRLENLRISTLSINNAGLAQLAGMHRLKRLGLKLGATTDDGLTTLAKLPALEDLTLTHFGHHRIASPGGETT